LLAVGGVATAIGVRRYKAREQQRAIWAARAQSIGAYLTMSPLEFKEALAFLCERDGCRDVRVVGGSGDLAADVIATTPSGYRAVIQAKRYGPGTTVGSGDVQKVNGTYRHAHGGHVAAIVTTSRFTRPAIEYAARVGIRLFDQNALAGWVSRTGPAPWH
jgi:restriction system protein